MVTVHGYNFVDSDTLACRFGDADAEYTRWISSSKIECEAPPHAVGEVSVELTTNGVDYTSNGVLFKYLPEVEVTSVTPAAGVVSGGTAVQVLGSGFLFSQKLLCRFGLQSVPAAYVSETELTCVSPLSSEVGLVDVSV